MEEKVLHKYVVNFETPYMAEKMGDLRSWVLNDGFYAIALDYLKNKGKLYDCASSGALIKGKWGTWLPDRLEENDIKLDFSIRGFKTLESNKKGRLNVQLYLIKHPILTLRSIFSTLMLFFK